MKRLLCILTSLACMLSFAACGDADDSSSSEKASVSSTADASETSTGDEEDTTASEAGSTQASTKSREKANKATEPETKAPDKTEPSTGADVTEATNASGSVQPSSSGSGGSTDYDDDDDIFGFDKINVDKSGETVVMNIPSAMFDEDDDEDTITYGSNTSFAAMVKQYDGVEINKNDAKKLVEIKMPKKEYEKFMDEFRAEFEKSLNEAAGSEEYPYITKITHNSNFSEFDVYITTKQEFEDNWGGIFFLTLYIESIYYYILDGNSLAEVEEKGLDIDDILKITVHDQDGKTYTPDDFD